MVCELGIPVLFVDGPARLQGRSLPADQLYMDNSTEIFRFVNDMLRQGKKRIGFIGDYNHCQSFYERYTAFRCAMLMANAPVEKRFCIQTSSFEEIEAALASLSDFPDAFVCAYDLIATETIYELRKLGISVPGDVEVCGFNDSPNSRIMTPTLTTVHIHTGVMAAAAIQLLLSRIDEPGLDFRTVHTETKLIYRDSTRR
jgi:LacI family transcriptional regulator